MSAKVRIEINGVVHKPVKIGKGCEECSLAKYCPKVIGSPCNNSIDHFIVAKVKEKGLI